LYNFAQKARAAACKIWLIFTGAYKHLFYFGVEKLQFDGHLEISVRRINTGYNAAAKV